MDKLNEPLIRKNHPISLTAISILFLVSLFTLSSGVIGLVENKTPLDLGSLQMLSSSFFRYIEYHAMIFLGGISLTITSWFLQQYLIE